jgi:hypothetical protein
MWASAVAWKPMAAVAVTPLANKALASIAV